MRLNMQKHTTHKQGILLTKKAKCTHQNHWPSMMHIAIPSPVQSTSPRLYTAPAGQGSP